MFVLLSLGYFVIIHLRSTLNRSPILFNRYQPMLHPFVRFFVRGLDTLVFGLMMLLLPLSPLTCTILSGRMQYLQQFRSTLLKSAQYAFALKRSRVVSRNLERKLSSASSSSERIEGNCTHCGQCCVDRRCVFLEWNDQGASRCSVYGNWFWRLTSCGDYPLDGESIAVYYCPSFKVVPIKFIR